MKISRMCAAGALVATVVACGGDQSDSVGAVDAAGADVWGAGDAGAHPVRDVAMDVGIRDVPLPDSALLADDAASVDTGMVVSDRCYDGDPCCGDHLVAHWAFDEGSGTSSADQSKNHNDATIDKVVDSIRGEHPDPAWTSGISGKAIHLNGIDELVVVPSTDSINNTGTTGAVSMAAWVRFDAVSEDPSSEAAVVSRQEHGTDFSRWSLGLRGNKAVCVIHDTIVAAAKPTVKAGEWVHLAAIFDGIACTLFVNGQSVASGDIDWSLSADDTPTLIGARQGATGLARVAPATIDEVYLFDAPLCDGNVEWLFNHPSAKFPQ